MKTITRIIVAAMSMLLVLSAVAGCASETPAATAAPTAASAAASAPAATAAATAASSAAPAAAGKEIAVISREEGSGTRDAFIGLFGVQATDASGKKVDQTTEEAQITNDTSVMLTTVAGNPDSIGYISLGSLNDTVKALKIDGAEATVDNIKAGTYKISRPFNIVLPAKMSDTAKDFVAYIMSADGQKVVADNKYIPLDNAPAYTAAKVSGKVVVAGSSSVTPLMEKLAEAYQKVNSAVTIDVQQSDSTTGIQAAINGTCDIGMASRDLKDTEKGVTGQKIATDGIAVIVNKANALDGLTKDQVKGIFTGAVTTWDEVK